RWRAGTSLNSASITPAAAYPPGALRRVSAGLDVRACSVMPASSSLEEQHVPADVDHLAGDGPHAPRHDTAPRDGQPHDVSVDDRRVRGGPVRHRLEVDREGVVLSGTEHALDRGAAAVRREHLSAGGG